MHARPLVDSHYPYDDPLATSPSRHSTSDDRPHVSPARWRISAQNLHLTRRGYVMTIRPRTWWLAGGCGCALVAFFLVVGAAFLWYLWPNPAPPRKPPAETRSETPEPNNEAPVVGRTVYSGQLEPGRDVTIRATRPHGQRAGGCSPAPSA
jgi:hypothetical protein